MRLLIPSLLRSQEPPLKFDLNNKPSLGVFVGMYVGNIIVKETSLRNLGGTERSPYLKAGPARASS
jgi:hypothetical protein